MSRCNEQWQMAAAGATAALLLGGCAMFASVGERYTPPPVGSTYERDIQQTGSYGKSYLESSKYVGVRNVMGREMHVHERSTGQNSMVDASGGWVGQFKGDAPIFTFDPPHGVGYPLTVGKTESRDVRITFHGSKQTVPFKASWKVEAAEDVTVPAGVFKTFRITYKDTVGTEGTWWIDPDTGIFVKWSARRKPVHPQGAGTQDAELMKLNLTR